MRIRFFNDEGIGGPHIHKHEVQEFEVEEVLRKPGEDRPGRDGSRVAIGQTEAGRHLKIVYVPEPNGAYVVSAYELKGKPLRAYRRRRKKGAA